MARVLLIMLFLTGCVATGPKSVTEIPHERRRVVHLFLGNECVDVSDGLYVQNEGNRIRVYKDRVCSYLANDTPCYVVYSGDSCFLWNRIFSVEGIDNYMTLNIMEF